jgi:hypothetical protein
MMETADRGSWNGRKEGERRMEEEKGWGFWSLGG